MSDSKVTRDLQAVYEKFIQSEVDEAAFTDVEDFRALLALSRRVDALVDLIETIADCTAPNALSDDRATQAIRDWREAHGG